MKNRKRKRTTDIEEAQKKEMIKQKRKGKVYLDSDDILDKTDLSTISSPQTFSQSTYHILSTACLKAFVEKMKLGKILKLRIKVIPSNIAWNILSCYDVGNKCLLLNGDRVDITRLLVFEIFGFPKGDLEISFVKRSNYDRLGNCYPGLIDCFWSQFELKKNKGATLEKILFYKVEGVYFKG
ncbi:hypothetical protein Tco_0278609 [Tanacetum coccineum]